MFTGGSVHVYRSLSACLQGLVLVNRFGTCTCYKGFGACLQEIKCLFTGGVVLVYKRVFFLLVYRFVLVNKSRGVMHVYRFCACLLEAWCLFMGGLELFTLVPTCISIMCGVCGKPWVYLLHLNIWPILL